MSRIYLAPTNRHSDADDRHHGDALHVNTHGNNTNAEDLTPVEKNEIFSNVIAICKAIATNTI